MIELNNNLRLVKRKGFHGDTWVCLESRPTGTWKKRQLWKPLTRPLYKTEVLAWLAERSGGAQALEQFNQSVETTSY